MEDSKVVFENMGLSPRVLSAVEDFGYESPTPIQSRAIPLALEGKDLLGLAHGCNAPPVVRPRLLRGEGTFPQGP